MNNFVDPSVSGIVGRDTLPALVWGLDVSPTFSGGQSQESDVCYQEGEGSSPSKTATSGIVATFWGERCRKHQKGGVCDLKYRGACRQGENNQIEMWCLSREAAGRGGSQAQLREE